MPNTPMFPDTKMIVFDLDGTLVDTFVDIAAAANDSLRRLGRPALDTATVTRHVGHGGRELMHSLLGIVAPDEKITEETIDRAFQGWRNYYLAHPCDLAKPYPGVLETLVELGRRGIRTGVLSNKSHDLTVKIAHSLKLAVEPDDIRGDHPSRERKPDPATLLEMISHHGVAPDEALLVGDGNADMQVAVNANMPAVAVSYGVFPAEELTRLGAATTIDALPELLALVGNGS